MKVTAVVKTTLSSVNLSIVPLFKSVALVVPSYTLSLTVKFVTVKAFGVIVYFPLVNVTV